MATKKRRPTDATLRNIRATRTQIAALAKRVRALALRVFKLENPEPPAVVP